MSEYGPSAVLFDQIRETRQWLEAEADAASPVVLAVRRLESAAEEVSNAERQAWSLARMRESNLLADLRQIEGVARRLEIDRKRLVSELAAVRRELKNVQTDRNGVDANLRRAQRHVGELERENLRLQGVGLRLEALIEAGRAAATEKAQAASVPEQTAPRGVSHLVRGFVAMCVLAAMLGFWALAQALGLRDVLHDLEIVGAALGILVAADSLLQRFIRSSN